MVRVRARGARGLVGGEVGSVGLRKVFSESQMIQGHACTGGHLPGFLTSCHQVWGSGREVGMWSDLSMC